MVNRIKLILKKYPDQFWLMQVGVLISSAGASMIWPFLMIYVSSKLDLPLGKVAPLVSINAATSLISSIFAGNLADKRGRKLVMVISLMTNSIIYLFMGTANTYLAFAVLMILTGASNPLYQVGADAMVADLIRSEDRNEAYAFQRMINNAGIAIGPAIGGFIASRSYAIAFWLAASSMLIYSLLMLFRAKETLLLDGNKELSRPQETFRIVLKDRKFLAFVSLVSFGLIGPSMMWVLLAVYTNSNFGMPEYLYGWIPTTNALMCVFIQLPVSRATRKFNRLTNTIAGMTFYALGVGSISLMEGFWGFWLSMVIITFGELLLIPTITTWIADRAPQQLKGRYFSVYWFGWGLTRVCSPLLGGLLNDTFSPKSIWIGGLIIGLTSSIGLYIFKKTHDPLISK